MIFAIPVITGSLLRSLLDAPSGLYDSVTMSCAAWYSRLSFLVEYGLSWI